MDVEVEAHLQLINGQSINSLIGDDASAKMEKNVFFDIRVTNSYANSQNHLLSTKTPERHEKERNASAIIVL